MFGLLRFDTVVHSLRLRDPVGVPNFPTDQVSYLLPPQAHLLGSKTFLQKCTSGGAAALGDRRVCVRRS